MPTWKTHLHPRFMHCQYRTVVCVTVLERQNFTNARIYNRYFNTFMFRFRYTWWWANPFMCATVRDWWNLVLNFAKISYKCVFVMKPRQPLCTADIEEENITRSRINNSNVCTYMLRFSCPQWRTSDIICATVFGWWNFVFNFAKILCNCVLELRLWQPKNNGPHVVMFM